MFKHILVPLNAYAQTLQHMVVQYVCIINILENIILRILHVLVLMFFTKLILLLIIVVCQNVINVLRLDV